MTFSRLRSETARWVWPITVAALSCAAMPATAQEARQDTTVLNPIVVEGEGLDPLSGGTSYVVSDSATGVKAGARITEIPQSLSVVTARELKDRAPAQLEDVVAYSAGITSAIWGVDDRFDQFLIRGFDNGTSGIFRDGLNQKVLNFSGFKIDPYLIERVDILRGPSGVLYGENDAGGMVNVITKRPQSERATETFLTFGANDVARAGIDATGPLNGDGSLSYRLVAVGQAGETEIRDSDNDRLLLAPSVTWQATPDTRVTLLAQWQKDRLTPNNFLPVAGEDYPLALGALPRDFIYSQSDFNRLETEQWSLGYEVEHRLTDALTLRQNFRYARQDTDYRHLYFSNMLDESTLNFAAFTVDETATQIRLDTQLQYDWQGASSRTTLLAGIDLARDEIDGRTGWAGGHTMQVGDPGYDFPVASPPIISDQKQVVSSRGLYAQGITRMDSGLTVTYGARKAWIENRATERLNDTVTTSDNDALVGMLGATWDLGGGWVPYASYTESFTTNVGTDRHDNLFKPTMGKQYEVGVKYAPDENSLYTLAIFDLKKDDVLTRDNDDPIYRTQTGQIRHKGIELEARTALDNGLSLIGSYTYLDAQITRSNDGDQGNTPALVPEHQAALWLDYDIGKAHPGSALAGLTLGGGLRYVGATWGDNGNSRRVDSYLLADLALRYRFQDYSVGLNVTNLFDEEYHGTCTASSGCILGEGRGFSLTLNRSF